MANEVLESLGTRCDLQKFTVNSWVVSPRGAKDFSSTVVFDDNDSLALVRNSLGTASNDDASQILADFIRAIEQTTGANNIAPDGTLPERYISAIAKVSVENLTAKHPDGDGEWQHKSITIVLGPKSFMIDVARPVGASAGRVSIFMRRRKCHRHRRRKGLPRSPRRNDNAR